MFHIEKLLLVMISQDLHVLILDIQGIFREKKMEFSCVFNAAILFIILGAVAIL